MRKIFLNQPAGRADTTTMKRWVPLAVVGFLFAAQFADLVTTLMPGGYESNPIAAAELAVPGLFPFMKLVVVPGVCVTAWWAMRQIGQWAEVALAVTLLGFSVWTFGLAAHNLTLV